MKKVSIFLVAFFPYCFIFDALLIKITAGELALTCYNFPIIIGVDAVLYVLARRGLKYLLNESDRKKLVKLNLMLKKAQIPAQLFNIVICVLFVLTLFGIMFAPFFIAVIVLSLHLTGQIGREAVRWCVEEGLLTEREAAWESKRQMIPCVDVISAAELYRATGEEYK